VKRAHSAAGFTVLEMVCAVLIVTVLAVIYFLMMDSYKDRRSSEVAAKVLMQSARVEEEFFAKEHRYFDAEVAGSGGETYLVTPSGEKSSVAVPTNVILSLRAVGPDKIAFVGNSFYTGSKVLHRYDSRTGKMTTVSRTQDEAG